MQPRRSCLYVPADKPRAIAKARTLAADVIILDLEDAVAPEAKAEARRSAHTAADGGGFQARELVVRVNADDAADLQMAATWAFDAVVLPKIETAGALVAAAALAPGKPLWAMIETPRALLNLAAIAGAAAPLACLIVGVNDLALALRCNVDSATIAHARQSILIAARTFDLDALDGVTNELDDSDRLAGACRDAVALGFDGKTLIHPSQIDTTNRAFTPSAADIDAARAIVAAFSDPANAGKGVLSVNGQMTERLHFVAAQRTLARAAY